MKTRRIAAVVLLSFAPSTFSLPAWSQDDPVTTQARARFKEGVEAFDKGKYEEARLSFLQAYTLKKHPAVLLNLAQSSAKSNHLLEASKYFQQFLKETTAASPQQRKDAESGLAEVRQKLGRIEVIATPGTEISLDDQGKVGTTPMDPIDVEPGSHTVKSPTQSTTVIAVVGQKVDAKLGGATTAPPPIPVTPPPATTTEPPPPATTTEPPAEPKHTNLLTRPENMTPVWVGLTAGGVGLIGAILFAAFKADAQSKADTVANTIRAYAISKNQPTAGACSNPNIAEVAGTCSTLNDNNGKVDTNATIANVSLVVMGLGLGLAGGWYLFAPKRDDARPAAGISMPIVTPWAASNSGGVSIAGQF